MNERQKRKAIKNNAAHLTYAVYMSPRDRLKPASNCKGQIEKAASQTCLICQGKGRPPMYSRGAPVVPTGNGTALKYGRAPMCESTNQTHTDGQV